MAKVKPSYDAVKHTGIAAGDDAPAATLAAYDEVRHTGVSTTSQPDGVSAPAATPSTGSSYASLQDPGKSGDSTLHGAGPSK